MIQQKSNIIIRSISKAPATARSPHVSRLPPAARIPLHDAQQRLARSLDAAQAVLEGESGCVVCESGEGHEAAASEGRPVNVVGRGTQLLCIKTTPEEVLHSARETTLSCLPWFWYPSLHSPHRRRQHQRQQPSLIENVESTTTRPSPLVASTRQIDAPTPQRACRHIRKSVDYARTP